MITSNLSALKATTAVRIVSTGRWWVLDDLRSSALLRHFHLHILTVTALRVTPSSNTAGALFLVQWTIATYRKGKIRRRVIVVHFRGVCLHTKVLGVAVRRYDTHVSIAGVQIAWWCFVLFVQAVDASTILSNANDWAVRVHSVVVVALELVVVMVRCCVPTALVLPKKTVCRVRVRVDLDIIQ